MSEAPRAIVFDLDGTLVDSVPGIERACRRAIAEVWPGQVLPPLAAYVGPPIRELLRRALDPPPEVLEALAVRFRAHYDGGDWREMRAYPGALDLLQHLRARGIAAHVVTNKPAAPTGAMIAALGWASLLGEVLSPDSRVPAFASKAEAVAALVASHALEPARTWVVGDAPSDAEAARANAMRFVAAAYGYGGLGPTAPDAAVLAAPADLIGLLG